MNAQIEPIEAALTEAGIAYQVRGIRFYDRPEVKAATSSLRRPGLDETGLALLGAIRRRWADEVGFEEDGTSVEGREAQERQSSLETLLAIVTSVVHGNPRADAASVIAELERRAAHERDNAGDGVNLLTYHRAKGLEWDAVFLPMLEEGSLPIRQALDDDAALAEERRLLYVGITRARVHLALSWAERRETRGREARRQPSRFLLDVRGPAPRARPRRPAGPPRTPDEAGRRRRPGVRRAPRVAHGRRPRRGHAPVRDRPRRDPRGHRRGPTGVAQRPSSGERHGPGQAREVRRRDPRRPRDGPGDAAGLLASAPARDLHRILRAVRMDRPYAGRTHREIT